MGQTTRKFKNTYLMDCVNRCGRSHPQSHWYYPVTDADMLAHTILTFHAQGASEGRKIIMSKSDDTISRQDAMNALFAKMDEPHHAEFVYCDEVKNILESLSSAEPKTGKWELDPNGMDWNIPAWRCSECGFVANYIGVEANGLGNNPMNWAGSKFCPNCGARMKGADDEADNN